jgi:hypothetical protein
MQKDLNDYVKLVEQCFDDMKDLHAKYILAIEECAEANENYEQMKHLVESKKNQMLSTGMVTGKNAEERSANLWIAITEYDDLQELSAKVSSTKTELEIAKSYLKLANDKMSFYTLMIEVLAGLDTNG